MRKKLPTDKTMKMGLLSVVFGFKDFLIFFVQPCVDFLA